MLRLNVAMLLSQLLHVASAVEPSEFLVSLGCHGAHSHGRLQVKVKGLQSGNLELHSCGLKSLERSAWLFAAKPWAPST